MAVYTIYCTNDGFVESTGNNWANVRNGAASFTNGGGLMSVSADLGTNGAGQYLVDQALMTFDTSSVVGTITDVNLNVYLASKTINVNFTMDVVTHNYTGAVDSTDWLPLAAATSATILSSLNTGSIATSTYNQWSSSASFISAINQSGSTKLAIIPRPWVVNTTPINANTTFWYGSFPGGTSQDAYLSITTSGGGSSFYPKVISY